MKKIYFIGGAPRTGKSTVLQRLNERHPLLTASTDAIRNVSKGMLRPEDNQKLFKVNGGNYASKEYQDMLINRPDVALDMEIAQSEEVWKSVLDFIGYYQRDGREAAIEGVAVLPKDLSRVEFEYKAVYLVAPDSTDAIVKHAMQNETDWLHKYDEQAIRAFCRFNVYWNNYYEKEAEKAGFPIVEVSSDNFEANIQRAVDILLA